MELSWIGKKKPVKMKKLYQQNAEVLEKFLKKRNGKEWEYPKADVYNPATGKFFDGINKQTLLMHARNKNYKVPNFLTKGQIYEAKGRLATNAKPVWVSRLQNVFIDQEKKKVIATEQFGYTAKNKRRTKKYEKTSQVVGYKLYHVNSVKGLPARYYKAHFSKERDNKDLNALLDQYKVTASHLFSQNELHRLGMVRRTNFRNPYKIRTWVSPNKETIILMPRCTHYNLKEHYKDCVSIVSKALVKEVVSQKGISEDIKGFNSLLLLSHRFVESKINKHLGLSTNVDLSTSQKRELIREIKRDPFLYVRSCSVSKQVQKTLEVRLEQQRQRPKSHTYEINR